MTTPPPANASPGPDTLSELLALEPEARFIRGGDDSGPWAWCVFAGVSGGHCVFGHGATRDEAIEDALRVVRRCARVEVAS